MQTRNITILILALIMSMPTFCQKVYIDKSGVIRWQKDKTELRLFGANYCLPSACDYRAANYVGGNHKEMIEEDMDHFVKMGFDCVRLCFWGDSENTDHEGNLIYNEHLDLLCYLINECTTRNIYMSFAPIVTYEAAWPEVPVFEGVDNALLTYDKNKGILQTFGKSSLITNAKAIKAQQNYITSLLNYRNPYTSRLIKDEPNILFLELINEPKQLPNRPDAMKHYINTMVKTVKDTGCRMLTFYNVSQDFKVGKTVMESDIDGTTWAWYPHYPLTADQSRQWKGNPLPFMQDYPQMRMPEVQGKPKMVYEFGQPDSESALGYPAMTKCFHDGGAQIVLLFSYDMLKTAAMNSGWRLHYINMVYTPEAAVGAMISQKITKSKSTECLSLCYSKGKELAIWNDDTCFIYSATNNIMPRNMEKLKHIIGVGKSPVADYDGTGIFFLDKQEDGTWKQDIYPDIVKLEDPFIQQKDFKHPVRMAIEPQHKMALNLPYAICSAKDFGRRITNSRNFRSPVSKLDTISEDGTLLLNYEVKHLEREPHDATLSLFVGDRIYKGMSDISIVARGTCPVTVTLIDSKGQCFSAEVALSSENKEYRIPLSRFKPGKGVLLPQDWPGACPYWYPQTETTATLDVMDIEHLQVSIRHKEGQSAEQQIWIKEIR